jgi:hypothetical protein
MEFTREMLKDQPHLCKIKKKLLKDVVDLSAFM